ncbi:hypothetical protein EA187_14350 [Lujinxingia sediminis]|uniref:Uncharacterized protein n=1 Tax=Lujinxingia sediminis TaxID=2480984 RepID=A0ABY0CS23_9DELT|nr:hypothetical protein [Lujinxingia sediminis]RVU43012.1 hypothetical protein EA187_14350 [Lujinxingia sediminis]
MSVNSDKDSDFSKLEHIKSKALRAIGEILPVESPNNYSGWGDRTNAGRDLPPQYLVYFLLIKLLRFPYVGRDEKVAWTVPIKFQERVFVIEHRKMGLGVFTQDPIENNELAIKIVKHIHRAVKAARPYFDWLASQAVQNSSVSVISNSPQLFARYEFLLDSYRAKREEMVRRKDEVIVTKVNTPYGELDEFDYPRFRLKKESHWLALSAVEAFFSWTEHVFVHLAILTGKISTGHEVTQLAQESWVVKCNTVLDLSNKRDKVNYDKLLPIRRALRNFIAHGAFGKDGSAFLFHSSAGAVPVVLPHQLGSRKFRVVSATYFDDEAAFDIINDFIANMWSGDRSPARLYIEDGGRDLILPMAKDGTYAEAMRSDHDMAEFVEALEYQSDIAANMDW